MHDGPLLLAKRLAVHGSGIVHDSTGPISPSTLTPPELVPIIHPAAPWALAVHKLAPYPT